MEFDNVGLELSINFEEFSEESDVVWCVDSPFGLTHLGVVVVKGEPAVARKFGDDLVYVSDELLAAHLIMKV